MGDQELEDVHGSPGMADEQDALRGDLRDLSGEVLGVGSAVRGGIHLGDPSVIAQESQPLHDRLERRSQLVPTLAKQAGHEEHRHPGRMHGQGAGKTRRVRLIAQSMEQRVTGARRAPWFPASRAQKISRKRARPSRTGGEPGTIIVCAGTSRLYWSIGLEAARAQHEWQRGEQAGEALGAGSANGLTLCHG